MENKEIKKEENLEKLAARVNKKRKLSANLISFLNPKAPASEAYRALRTNIGYASIDEEVKVIVLTSPGMAEGKSTTCCNIAVTMAQANKRVLLIDCDLRKPKIHRYFSFPNDIGITNILVDNTPIQDTIKAIDEIDNLYLIGSGSIPPNPAEILQSKKMKELIGILKEKFDAVIIDTPPVAQFTDAAVLGGMADGVILVIASGSSNIDQAKHSKEALENVKARILGVVLSKIDKATSGSYYYKYYNYDSYYYD